MAGPVILRSGEGWEIVNDDGLIYKRRKTEADDSTPSSSSSSLNQIQEPPTQKPQDVHWRRTRKKAALRQLKSRYLAEIDEWEKLFERLDKPPECTPIQKDVSDPEASENPIIKASEKQFGTLVEKLSCEVEQLGMFMQEFKALCCDCEYICKRPDEYGEFYDQIKSPRLLVKALQVANESTIAEQEKTP